MQVGRFQPARAVIRVSPFEAHTSYAPYTCPQCAEAWCLTACPIEAIGMSAIGARVVRDDQCIGCKLCTISCPYGTIGYDAERRKAVKCDLCGGTPACAEVCPTAAIEYVETEASDWLAAFAAERSRAGVLPMA
jgi:carbon-monoxide dehydrogenase iron sulfur subunit